MAGLKASREKITVCILSLLICIGFFSLLTHPTYSIVHNASLFSPQSSQDTTITVDTTLVADMVANNLTVEPNAILITNGYQIFCKGNFTNYGTVESAYAPRMNYPVSYGGSGGGAWEYGNETIGATSANSTIAAGGIGSDRMGVSATSGNYVMLPNMTSSIIGEWYSSGLEKHLVGAAGQSVHLVTGGLGAYGLYIQAGSIINDGLITTAGQSGSPDQSFEALTGGGGGGVLILAYQYHIQYGAINSQGGGGSLYPSYSGAGGAGGSGQVATVHFGSNVPVPIKDVRKFMPPPFAFQGAYANYSIDKSINGVTSHLYMEVTIVNVNDGNQTFTFREITPPLTHSLNTIVRIPASNYTISFTDPSTFPAVDSSDLYDLAHSTIPAGLLIGASNTTVSKNVTVTVPAGKFSTYRIGYGQPGFSESIWIDIQTGLIVKEAYWNGIENLTSVLSSTNIIPSDSISFSAFYALIPEIAVPIVSLAVVLHALLSKKRKRKRIKNQPDTLEINAMNARMDELKSMLDKGIISREYYDESMKRFRT